MLSGFRQTQCMRAMAEALIAQIYNRTSNAGAAVNCNVNTKNCMKYTSNI